MTKTDYTGIAYTFAQQRKLATPVEAWRLDETARALADYFESDNPRFNRAQFLFVCGVEA